MSVVEISETLQWKRGAVALRFEKCVLKTDTCWLWLGPRFPLGYGMFRVRDGKQRYAYQAHRVSYELRAGPIPSGLCVLHRCDVPRCVNPDHLFLGTKSDNACDMFSKGRAVQQAHPELIARGERIGISKLTEEAVREIRRRVRCGESYSGLAREFGVAQSTLYLAAIGRTWKHVHAEEVLSTITAL